MAVNESARQPRFLKPVRLHSWRRGGLRQFSFAFLLLCALSVWTRLNTPSFHTTILSVDKLLPWERETGRRSLQTSFPRGHVHDTFFRMNLSHLAFHAIPGMKGQLIKLVCDGEVSACPIAIVGLEAGAEFAYFARLGHPMFAFEPNLQFVNESLKLVREQDWNATIFNVAAVESSDMDQVTITYNGVSHKAPAGRIDAFLPKDTRLVAMSLDIQGLEYKALKGAEALLDRGHVQSLWVELIACNELAHDLLSYLDKDFAIFDTVPWGHRLIQKEYNAFDRLSFVYPSHRPSNISDYVHWLCEQKESHFHWLQTDLVAFRRDWLDSMGARQHEIMENIGSLSCSPDAEASCALRSILRTTSEAW